MEILQLKYFCDAAQTQNFSKTAEKFMVPPSNISQTIKRLEKELGTPLFERCANKVKLNDSGMLFYRNAASALGLLEDAEKTLKNIENSKTIKINIHIHRRIAMQIIESFRKLHPEVSFTTSHNIEDFSDSFDIIISDKELELPYLKTKVSEEKFLLAYNKSNAEFVKSIDKNRLENLPFITMNAGSSVYQNTLLFCRHLGFSPNIVLQSEDPFYIRKCIELGIGIAVVPEFSWSGQLSDNVALKSIVDLKRKIYVYKKHGMSRYINEFCDMLIQEFPC